MCHTVFTAAYFVKNSYTIIATLRAYWLKTRCIQVIGLSRLRRDMGHETDTFEIGADQFASHNCEQLQWLFGV